MSQEPNSQALTARIRMLNDHLRTTRQGGRCVMTAGVAALSPSRVALLWRRVAEFNEFDPDNDPYGEHDFGRFEQDGESFFWKVDYYDKDVRFGSDDPADPGVTTRVLTLMLASEY
ncbi:MAG: DUF3768 domain-containing protein [Alphaproteobacteria bacterium]|nr:DUF3768 domain-containing protein [Alphaproteobacteria bacterium]